MTVKVEVLQGTGSFKGSSSNVGDFSVTEDATPLNPADSSGGVGEFSFDVAAEDDTLLLFRSEIQLTDGDYHVRGKTTSVIDTDGFVSASVQTRLSALVAELQIPPAAGTLGSVLRTYLGLVNIPAGNVVVPTAIANRNVAYPGGFGDLWVWIKDICAAEQIELYVEGSNYVFALPRGRALPREWDGGQSVTVAEGQIARSVEVKYYNNEYRADSLAYPPGGWDEDVQVYQVGAGETTEVDLQLGASLLSFKPPIMVTSVAADYAGPNSVYCIAGNDGLPVPVALWRDAGGKLELELDETTTVLKLTLTGPQGSWAENYGPFRVAMAADSGGSSTYSSLRIVGTGVFFDEREVIVPTGVPEEDTAQEVGITIENRAISTLRHAYEAATLAANAFSGQTIELSADASRAAPLAGESGALSGYAGARVSTEDSRYRVRNVSYTPTTIQYTADSDVLFSDFNSAQGGKTFTQFNNEYAGWTFYDLAIKPL